MSVKFIEALQCVKEISHYNCKINEKSDFYTKTCSSFKKILHNIKQHLTKDEIKRVNYFLSIMLYIDSNELKKQINESIEFELNNKKNKSDSPNETQETVDYGISEFAISNETSKN